MADLRKSTANLDDFNRANANPASGSWGEVDTTAFGFMSVNDNALTHGTGESPANGYWTEETFSGDNAQVWAAPIGGGEISGIAWAMGLWASVGGTNTVTGYRFRWESVGDVWTLRKYTGGLPGTLLTSDSSPNPPVVGALMMFCREGNDIVGYVSNRTHLGGGVYIPDPTGWIEVIRYTDTTYMTGLHLGLGITDNAQTKQLAWDYFGGGARRPRTQIYRYVSN